ncbi:putative methyltransferase type 11 [Diplodia seriata]|uniref:Putative methyltransferase type 11 n=1 Tax=Diplodia seriata TaxID=420778 RepID=A0A0G2DVU2_9PEZI|nr:putative methyltransferase type 11 [Diplodia seriata]
MSHEQRRLPVPPACLSSSSSVGANSPFSIIEADSEQSEDSQSCSNSTKSVRESIFDYIKENGRTYHRYASGSSEFPGADITGTDLSPIQPEWVPENVQFVIDDAQEEDWLIKPDSYDYIHTRVLLGSFEDFREVVKKSYKYLKPGGWMESQEFYSTLYCDDGTMGPDYAFAEWTRTQDAAAMNLGRPLRIANKLKRWYEEQGFVDVHEEVFKLPINPWPKDPQLKMLGRFSENSLLEGIQAFSLAWFHRGLGWTKDEIEVYLVQVRKAIADRSVHAYHKV